MNHGNDHVVRVSIISGQHPVTGQRIMNSVAHHNLHITQAAFTGGESPVSFIRPMGGDIFLTKSAEDAQNAIDAGIASAILRSMPESWLEDENEPVRIALDGDAVLFTDECEAIARRDGLDAFMKNENENRDIPLSDGPFGHFFRLLHLVRERRPGEIRLSLVTARSGIAAHRALFTLHQWGCDPDDAFMLGSLSKGPVIEALRPHIFLDDGERHVNACSPHAPSGLVPYRTDGSMSALTVTSS
jgi:5'-nucleotidase